MNSTALNEASVAEVLEAKLSEAARMAFVERVAVRKRGGQVKNTWKQGLVGAPEVGWPHY